MTYTSLLHHVDLKQPLTVAQAVEIYPATGGLFVQILAPTISALVSLGKTLNRPCLLVVVSALQPQFALGQLWQQCSLQKNKEIHIYIYLLLWENILRAVWLLVVI